PGEYVINAEAVKKLGTPFLESINRGVIPGFNKGGYVRRTPDDFVRNINEKRARIAELEQKIQEHTANRPGGAWKPTISKWQREMADLQLDLRIQQDSLRFAVEQQQGTTLEEMQASK